MPEAYQKIIDQRLKALSEEGRDKVVGLEEAVTRYMEPGMNLHPVSTRDRYSCSINETIRRFPGKRRNAHSLRTEFTGASFQKGSLEGRRSR